MNNPNPFVPQGSLLEHHKRRSRMKLAVGCAVAISVCGLSAMLIQGCKREQAPPEENQFADTNVMPMIDTNPPVMLAPTNPPPIVTPMPVVPEVPTPTTTEYVVVKGDYLAKIAKENHVSLKALEDANPGVTPTRLRIGQKLQIPAPTETGASASPMNSTSGDMNGGQTYAVKSGDSMSKIAKINGVSLKALEAANPTVDPNHIKVGQKLKLPARVETTPAPSVNMPPPVSSPMPVAPAGNPPQQ
jgi:LysM repeat protein